MRVIQTTALLDLLQTLEAHFPPGDKCHHSITAIRYGSDETGWTPKLRVTLMLPNRFLDYLIDEGDTIEEIISFIVEDQSKVLNETCI